MLMQTDLVDLLVLDISLEAGQQVQLMMALRILILHRLQTLAAYIIQLLTIVQHLVFINIEELQSYQMVLKYGTLVEMLMNGLIGII